MRSSALDKNVGPKGRLLSIGIQRGTIDLELYARWFKSGSIRAWEDAEPFVRATRARFGNNLMIYHEFQEMVRWFQGSAKPPRRRWWSGFFF
jgi:hypothetical protein